MLQGSYRVSSPHALPCIDPLLTKDKKNGQLVCHEFGCQLLGPLVFDRCKILETFMR